MIIDNTQTGQEHIPATLNGEVLLEEPAGGGFLTCPQHVAHELKQGTQAQRAAKGYAPFEAMLLALDTSGATLLPLADYKKEVIRQLNERLANTRFKDLANVLVIFREAKAYQAAGNPANLDDYPFIEAESDVRAASPTQIANAIVNRVTAMRAAVFALRAAATIDACMAARHNLDDEADLEG